MKYKKQKNILSILTLIVLLVLGPTVYFRFHKPKPTKAASWAQNANGWSLRKRLTLVNNSGQAFESGTTYSLTLNTKALYDAGNLKSGCEDIRVYYQPSDTSNTKLNYYVEPASGTTCATSEATTLHFPLQAAISNNGEDGDYYLYYKNPSASSESTVNAFNVGSAQATFYCGFKGSTTCANITGTTNPTTQSGAIRYSGAKGGIRLDGVNDDIDIGKQSSINNLPEGSFTIEGWIYPKFPNSAIRTYDYFFGSKSDWDGSFMVIWHNDLMKPGVTISCSGTNGGASSNTALAINQWSHLAITYSSQDKIPHIFINGQEVNYAGTPTACTGNYFNDSSKNKAIGSANWTERSLNAIIDEFRISNNVRYTSNFTPQTTPFIRDEFTKLLLHFDENGDDPRNTGKAIDDSGNANHGTITGAKYVSGLIGVDQSTSDTGNISANQFAAHGGVFIEEGTTNLITNPSFEHATYNLGWTTPYLNYSSNASTFSPLLSKRNSYGPFAAGVMVQGDKDTVAKGDVLTSSVGSEIKGNFYPTFDGDQGSIVFWITPEWNGNDGKKHYIYYAWSKYVIVVYKGSDNKLYLDWGWGRYVSADISNWTSGNTYNVVIRWDGDNKLDSTNFMSISVNNSHTFGYTGSSFVQPPLAGLHLGSVDEDYGTDAIIEGFTIYRRPLWDGTYGINVGNGDEIEQIYNSGTGQDPTLITGSWDVVFDLPTDSTTGSIGTGTSNAWSHPHSSNVLYTNTTNTGGFMMGIGYSADGWALELTPTSISGLTAPEMIYSGGYKWTSDAYNEGIKYTKSSLTAGQNYVVRAVANSSGGTGQPKIFIRDETNGADITSFTGTTGSGRTAPDVLLFTFELPTTARNGVGSDCTSISVKLVNAANSGTVHFHQIELLENKMDNPSMETGSGDPWLPSGYTTTEGGADAGESSQSSTAHSGTYALKFTTASSYLNVLYSHSGTFGNFYSLGGWMRETSGSQTIGYGECVRRNDGAANLTLSAAGDSYSHYVGVFAKTVPQDTKWVRVASSANTTSYVDDIYSFELNNVSLTVTPASLANSTESTGLRVDGSDSLTMPITGIDASRGMFKFKMNPRHNFGIGSSFGFASPVIFTAYGDADDYIKVYKQGNSLMTLASFAGTTAPAIWSSPTLNVGGTYPFVISYARGGSLTLGVGNSVVATGSIGLGLSFGTTPTTAYFGSDSSGTNQYDCTITSFESLVPASNTTSPYYKFGSKSIRLIATQDDEITISIDPNSTAVHYLYSYVYNGTSGSVGGTVNNTVAQIVWEGIAQSGTSYTDMGGGWWRMKYSGNTTDSNNNYGVRVLAGKTVYIDGVQLSANKINHVDHVILDTYVDGSLGTGYSWFGTANESVSSRADTDLRYPAINQISPSSGTISFWIKPDQYLSTNSEFRILEIGGLTGSQNGSLELLQGGGPWNTRFQIRNNSGTTYTISKSGIYSAGTWRHIVLVWNENDMRFYSDGSSQGTPITSATMPTSWYSNQIIFGYNLLTGYTVSDFKIFSSPLSASEVTDLYYSGLGSHKEGSATEQFNDGEPATSLWHLDEGTGNTIYDSLGSMNGSLSTGGSAPTWTSGASCISGNCLSFDGSDYASVPGNIIGIKTLSFWVKPSSATTSIMNLNSSQSISLTSNILGTTNVTSPNIYINGKRTTTVNTDEWSHVIITSDTAFGTSDLTFGKVGTNYFTGYLDEIRVYPYVLSVDQVNKDMNFGAGTLIGGGPEIPQVTPISSKLVAYWPFDEGYGTVTHGKTGSNNGNLGGGDSSPSWNNNGKIGKALNFDGNDCVQILTSSLDSIGATGSFTISAWNFQSSFSGYKAILSQGYGNHAYGRWMLGTNSNKGFLSLYGGTSSPSYKQITGTKTLLLNTWNHFVGVYNRDLGTMTLYTNGLLDSSIAWDGYIENYENGKIEIGRLKKTTFDFALTGLIDEVKIYNTALTANEVKQDYNQGSALVAGSLSSGTGNTAPNMAASQEYCIPGDPSTCSGPIARWDFNEGVGTSAFDTSGNGNNGTLVNSPGWVTGKIGKALNFNGSGKKVTIATPFGQSGYTTVSLWYKRDENSASTSWRTLIGHATANIHHLISHSTSRNLGIWDGAWQDFGYNPPNDGKWHNLTVIYNSGTNATLYANGIYINQISTTLDLSTNPIGSIGNWNGNSYWAGQIDQVRIYNYARAPAQIAWDYNKGAPVAHYKLDECQGTTAHDSISGLHGTITIGSSGSQNTAGTCSLGVGQSSAWANGSSGKYNASLNFDGADDYVGNINISSTLSSVTISAWIYINSSTGTWQVPLAVGSNPTINIACESSDNQKCGCDLYNSVTNPRDIGYNTWTLITCVKDSSGMTQYINGKYSAYEANASSITNPTVNIGRGRASEYYTKGQMDDVKIWNYALTSDQVKLLYNQGAVRFGN